MEYASTSNDLELVEVLHREQEMKFKLSNNLLQFPRFLSLPIINHSSPFLSLHFKNVLSPYTQENRGDYSIWIFIFPFSQLFWDFPCFSMTLVAF